MRVNFNSTLSERQIFCNPKPKSVSQINPDLSNNVVYIPCITFEGTKKHPLARPMIYGAESDKGAKAGGVSLVVTDLANTFEGYEFTPYYGGRTIEELNKKDTMLSKTYTLPNGTTAKEHQYKFKRTEVLTRIKDGKEYPVFIHHNDLYAAGGDVNKVPAGKVQWLEEVCSKEIETASGKEKAVIYKVIKGKEAKPTATRFYVFTQGTAAMKEAYAGGSFAYSTGASILGAADPYSVNSKAFIEMLPDLAKKGIVSKGIMFTDPQTAYACEFLARKILAGDEFYTKLIAGYICHNPGAGYQAKASLQSMFLNFATQEEIDKINSSPVFQQIKDKNDYIKNKFFSYFMPKLVDENGETSGLMMALRYRENGLLNYMGTVAPGAAESYCLGRGDTDGVKALMKELFKKGMFQGILNGLSNPNIDPRKPIPQDYYKPEAISEIIKFTDEEKAAGIPEKLKELTFRVFNPDKPTKEVPVPQSSYEEILRIKQGNAASFMERINLSQGDKHPEYAMGAKKASAKIWGTIDRQFIDQARDYAAGRANEPVNVFVSWGRADEQKGLDNAIESFKRFVHKSFEDAAKTGGENPAKNTVLIMGGPIGDSHLKDAIRKQIADTLSDPLMKGRFAFLDAFAPNSVLASASTHTLALSRWAPCELVDHEGRRYCSIPIVTGIEGLDDKNFDARYEADKKPTGYKTKHNDLTSIEEIKEELEYNKSVKSATDTEKYFATRKEKLEADNKKLLGTEAEATTAKTGETATAEAGKSQTAANKGILQDLKDKITDAEAKVAEEKKKTGKTKSLQEAEDNLAGLKKDLNKAEARLKNNNETIRKMDELQAEILKRLEHEEGKTKDGKVTEKGLKALQKEKADLEQQLKEATQKRDTIAVKIAEGETATNYKELKQQVAAIKAKIQKVTPQIEKKEKALKATNIKIQTLQEELDALCTEAKKLSGNTAETVSLYGRASTLSARTRELLVDYEKEIEEFKKKQLKIYATKHFSSEGLTTTLAPADIEQQIEIQLKKEIEQKSKSPIWQKRQAVIDSATNDDLVEIYKAATQSPLAERCKLMRNNWEMPIAWRNNSTLQRIWKIINNKLQPAKTTKTGHDLYWELCFNNPKPTSVSERLVNFTHEALMKAQEAVTKLLQEAGEQATDLAQEEKPELVSGNGKRFIPQKTLTFAEKYMNKQTAIIAGGTVILAGLAYYLFKPQNNSKENNQADKKHASNYVA